MNLATNIQISRPASAQMRAVMLLLSAEPTLQKALAKFVDQSLESIEWDGLFKAANGADAKVCVHWAYAIWRDEIKPKCNILERTLDAEPAVLRPIFGPNLLCVVGKARVKTKWAC